MLNISNVKKI